MPSDPAITDASRKTVVDFFELAFVEKQPAAAARIFIGERYIQHNPDMPEGNEIWVQVMNDMLAQHPHFKLDIKRVIAEGEMVVVHHHTTMNADEPGMAAVDILRVKDGKVVEHWDVLQPVPTEPANQNTMF